MAGLPKRDSWIEPAYLILAVVPLAFFLYVAATEPESRGGALRYIWGILGLVFVASAMRWRHPYSDAAIRFRGGEIARIHSAMEQRLDSVQLLSPREFEMAIARLFEQQGWEVELTAATADGGKDLILRREGKTYFVEVKRFAPERKVGRPLIMKLHSAMTHESADYGIFVTTSEYTEPAFKFATQNRIRLIDGPQLATLLDSTYPGPQGPLYFHAMCKRCGETIPFPERELRYKPCVKGHLVANPSMTDHQLHAKPA